MARNKIIFHIGSQPNATGYGDYIRALDAAGIPAGCMSMAGEGLGDIIACWDAGSLVEHTAVVRYMPPPGHPDGWQDVPRYDMEEEPAAIRFWAWVKPLIGPDVKRYSQRIVLKMGNELDKAQSEWLAGFYIVLYDIMQSDPDGPFRLGAFGFASGEPEPEHWRGARMLDYLRLCADDPKGAAIVLHEYSYADTLQSGYPFLIGRFQDLFAACDENGIKRPCVYIHEWGWRQDTMPPVNEAMAQLPWAAELYAKFPEIKGAGLWTLQGSGTYGNPHISKLAQPMIEPIKNYTLTAEFPDPPEEPQQPPDGGGGTMEKEIEVTLTTELPGQPVQIRGWDKATGRKVKYVQRRWMHHDGAGIVYTGWETIPIPTTIADLRGIEFMPVHDFTVTKTVTVDCPDEPTNPNPPPVVSNPLPQGALWVDVSANNKVVNLAALKAKGVQGVGIRLSNGIRKNTDTTDENGVDKMAFFYIAEAEALDMPWLAYHYANEHYDDVEQVRHFLGIANQAIEAGHIPEMGLWIDFETPQPPVQGSPTTEDRIQLQLAVLASERPSFIADFGVYTGKGWWDGKVPNAAAWVPALGLKAWAAAWVPTGTLVNGWPPSWWHPANLKGFTSTHFWQWTSAGGDLVGHSVASLDLNYVGNTAVVPDDQPDPPTPPTGKTMDFSPYLIPPSGSIGPFLVFEKVVGGTIDHQVQVKNGIVYVVKRAAVGTEYEELRISNGYIERRYDTSPSDGLPYKLDDGHGWSRWMPATMTEGEYYKRAPRVTKYDVANNCQLIADQGISESYIYFAKYHDSYVLPGGVVKTAVCELHWLWAPGGTILEKYFVAPGLWYIQWGNGSALHYLNEEPQGREPLPLSPVACLG